MKNSCLIEGSIADSIPLLIGGLAMMGPKQEAQAALFYEFSLEDHVPKDHLLRPIDRFVDLDSIRTHQAARVCHRRHRHQGLGGHLRPVRRRHVIDWP